MTEWLKRIAGYGLIVAAPFVTARFGEVAGAAVGALGGRLLHISTPTLFPKKDSGSAKGD